MTGFGRATVESPKMNVTVEIKSLNSKFLDIYCRIPRNYSEREIEIRNLITQRLERGKVEVGLNIVPVGDTNKGTAVNRQLVRAYYKDIYETARELSIEPVQTELLKTALSMPNAYFTDAINEADQAAEWIQIKEAVEQALNKCDDFRIQDGVILVQLFKEAIATIETLLIEVEKQDIGRIPLVRERLKKNITDLLGEDGFDPNRFEQELIYYVERYDISEEKVRLKNHLTYFIETLSTKDSNGKKLSFIAQEIGREVNTIGSKANDAGIQRLVVEMKDELEKIKEQTANVI